MGTESPKINPFPMDLFSTFFGGKPVPPQAATKIMAGMAEWRNGGMAGMAEWQKEWQNGRMAEMDTYVLFMVHADTDDTNDDT